MLDHILLPLDESELSERAVEFAKQIVAPNGRITLLTVVEVAVPTPAFSPVVYPWPADYDQLHQHALEQSRFYLERILDRVSDIAPTSDICVRSGSPADAIIEAALEGKVDAIVMSTHGRSGVSRWVFGSVTQKVLSAAPCPVLVVPPGIGAKP